MGQIASFLRYDEWSGWRSQMSHWCFHNDCQEIVPHLFLGHVGSATDPTVIAERKIRKIVDVSQRNYTIPPDIDMLRLDVPDDPGFDIRTIFPKTNAFIARAVESGQNCLVHCAWGVSRSTSIVLAYLMAHRNLTLDASLALAKEKRPVCRPNVGFLACLRAYEKELEEARLVEATLRTAGRAPTLWQK
jgi:atypical dual specificity phosphatase